MADIISAPVGHAVPVSRKRTARLRIPATENVIRMASPVLPSSIGPYALLREIGRGSMGIVYEAVANGSEHPVAVKVARHALADAPIGAERLRSLFFTEARAASLLDHPAILRVLDADIENDRCYLAMELVRDCRTLRPHCSPAGLLPLERVAGILVNCANALGHAHERGVIHRDLKPSNVLLTANGEIRIADFSIAHITRPDLASTLRLGFLGSPRYMSPEQIQEDLASAQSDLFALGVVAYELLTGYPPFGAEGFSALVHAIVNEPPCPLRLRRAGVPAALETIVLKLLEKYPEDRFASGRLLASALEEVLQALPVEPGVTNHRTER